MNDYDFGYDDGSGDDQSLGETAQGPKALRDHLKQISNQLNELKAENASLRAEKQRETLTEKFRAAGYAPGAASLYSGEPEKVDDWLKQHGEHLVKLPAQEGEETEQAPAGPPKSTVSAEGQAQMQQMAEAGVSGVAEPQGSDKELAAALAAASTPEEFEKIMRANGNRHQWT